MLGANLVHILMSSTSSLSLTDGSSLFHSSEYRRVVGSLQYLFFTRLDIAFDVNKLPKFMHKP